MQFPFKYKKFKLYSFCLIILLVFKLTKYKAFIFILSSRGHHTQKCVPGLTL
jgi:hypothetical protein